MQKEIITHELKLRFFDLDVDIKSDSGDFINRFARLYRRFLNSESKASAWPPVECVLLTHPDKHWGKPVLILDGEVWTLNDPALVEGYTYESIMCAVLTKVRSHMMIHAGAVSVNGQGIILAADTMHGKTTLVLELVRRGFKFLSDEFASLGRTDRLVHPCPRSLCIRNGALERAGFSDTHPDGEKWLGKMLLDIEDLKPGSMGMAAPVNHIIILKNPLAATEPVQGVPAQEVRITVDRLYDDLLDAIGDSAEVDGVRVDTSSRYPVIRIRSACTNAAISKIEVLLKKYGVLMLDIKKGVENYPTFKTTAQLSAMEKSHAVMELLRHFQGGYESEILRDEFGGDSARLFMELSAIVGNATCYELSVGPLNEMGDLVCRTVDV